MNYYFVTGTSSGIGRALVEELVKLQNSRVIGFSRSNTLTDDHFEYRALDLSDSSQMIDFEFDSISSADSIVLVNNAATLGTIDYVGRLKNVVIQDVMQVNFTSAAILINKFIKSYQDVDCKKVIINISSGAATSPYDGWANYCSAKSALNMFTQVVHKEQQIREYPIRTFAIAPGVVDTLMQDAIRKVDADQFSQIDKFKELKRNNELYTTYGVAQKLMEMILNPNKIPSLISRISL